jgi:uncharacterized protein (DUF697 family)
MGLPVKPLVVLGLLRELQSSAHDARPLAVGGALAPQLVKELSRGGRPGAVREAGPEGAAAYVHVLAGAPSPEDEAVLRRARRGRVPVVVLARERYDLPHVLPTSVVLVPPGQGFPVEELAGVLASRLGESATSLAARLPVLRGPVCDALVTHFARRNGLIGAAVFIPGVDMPVLTLNQMRLVLRIAAAHGEELSNERVPELLAVLGGAFVLRAIARELVDVALGAGFVVKAGVAYAGTCAVGEAAVRLFAARADSRA